MTCQRKAAKTAYQRSCIEKNKSEEKHEKEDQGHAQQKEKEHQRNINWRDK